MAQIGQKIARKSITYYAVSKIVPSTKRTVNSIGVSKGVSVEHHAFIFYLYLDNSSRPSEGYYEELDKVYGIRVAVSFITLWLENIGPFKGNYKKTSRVPPDKFSPKNYRLMQQYLTLVSLFRDPSRSVFADKKSMK